VVTDDTVAVNWALLDAVLIVTWAGTLNRPELLDKATVTGLVAASVSVTVQAEVPGALTFAGEQNTPPRTVAAFKLTEAVAVWPLQVAVTVAVWSLLNVPAVAVNVPLLDPVVIVMLAGTLNRTRLLDNATVAALVAALVSVTVQVALCPVPRVPGVQLNPDNCNGATRFSVKFWVTPPPLVVITAV
jgi:hypothetical protein